MTRVRSASVLPSWVRDKAKKMAASSARSRSPSHAIIDGYMIRAMPHAGGVADAIDLPAKLLHCQPYNYSLPDGRITYTLWQQALILPGRDPLSVRGYKPLSYALGDDPDIIPADMRRRQFSGSLRVGIPPSDGWDLLARGVYHASIDVVGTASVHGDWDGDHWLSLSRMDAQQHMLRADASADDISALRGGERRESNVIIHESSIGSVLYPPEYSLGGAHDYTVTPGFIPRGLRDGTFYAHTFSRRSPEPTDGPPLCISGIVSGTYKIDGEYPDRGVSVSHGIVSLSGLEGLLSNGNIRLMRAAVGLDGCGVIVAQADNYVEYANSRGGYSWDYATGCIAIPLGPLPSTPVVISETAMYAGPDDAMFFYTPILGVANPYPMVICHRARRIIEHVSAGQDAEDLSISIVTESGGREIYIPGFHPVMYTPRDAYLQGGRIRTGIWRYPVGAGDWQSGLVQSACQCGDDAIAVVVRPNSQFAEEIIDMHIAIVRPSDGALLSIGGAVARGSRWMHAGISCIDRGTWADQEETSPARMLLTLYRESGAPAEPHGGSVPGTYRLFESGRVCELAISYLTSSLCYYIGNSSQRTNIAG